MQSSRGARRIVWMTLLWTLASGAAVRGEPPAEAAEQKKAWDREIAAITELLIDGSFAPVRQRAIRLLEEEELPDDSVLRVQDLLATAAAKLREGGSQAESPAEPSQAAPHHAEPDHAEPDQAEPAQAEPAPSEPEPSQEDVEIRITPSRKKPPGKDPEPIALKSFRVRLAEVGGGFTPGANGVLRLSDDGLRLVPEGKKMKGWAIRWADLAAARPDDGMWDSPYPLVITDRGGHKYFVTRIDGQGRYLPGSPILAAIAQARKKRPAGDGR